MTGNAYRVAIGTMATPQVLCAALGDLRSVPLGLHELCCVGTGVGLEQARLSLTQTAPLDEGLLSVVRDVEPIARVGGATEILATSNRLLTLMKTAAARETYQLSPGACWLTPADQGDLLRSLEKGEVAVVVTTPSDRAWTASTHTLLRHSSSPVQGYLRTVGAVVPRTR